jgi:hypothetical protein
MSSHLPNLQTLQSLHQQAEEQELLMNSTDSFAMSEINIEDLFPELQRHKTRELLGNLVSVAIALPLMINPLMHTMSCHALNIGALVLSRLSFQYFL